MDREFDAATMSIGFIGAGKMAQALTRGFLASRITSKEQIIASAPTLQSISDIKKYGIHVTCNNQETVQDSKVVVVAVKPNVVPSVLREVSPVVTRDHLFVSIAAGVRIKSIEEELPPQTRVVRVMPNTPCLVQQAVSVLSTGSSAKNGDAEFVKRLMSAVGHVEESDENILDAVTGLSGCGPGYMFMALDAMADGGVRCGLPRDKAVQLAAHTMMGAAKMVLDSGKHPAQLKDDVCSPSGATIHAISRLEKLGFRGAIIDAVMTAFERTHELGQSK
ncbi:pyrroline-5-carboxylate reductase 2-like [Corticium candelabrum]|uniref:pyrroline-5-carboxylate reductase 2-like n=1 Tax=Corticium candelabrum TaxID=121492 RepID=UPI002E256E48|nr:pyrroline-5-carboxylate reductase 2-like [Corticium candelabrum]